ncbi:MAG: DUF2316 family protein [Eubacterium sp.]|nr:DUF2316 family protein [Eubacterium sp.]
MLNEKEKAATARELQINYAQLESSEAKVLKDLAFSKAVLEDALNVCRQGIAAPGDVWKLRDYLEEKLRLQNKPLCPFSVLKPGRNHWFSYEKTW